MPFGPEIYEVGRLFSCFLTVCNSFGSCLVDGWPFGPLNNPPSYLRKRVGDADHDGLRDRIVRKEAIQIFLGTMEELVAYRSGKIRSVHRKSHLNYPHLSTCSQYV